jgi:hypothetical protein
MKSKALLSFIVVASGLAFTPGSLAQAPKVDFPSASPTSTLKQHVGLTDIEIVYSRPGMKGRAIFGGLVSYGEVWRTGANQSTKVKFSTAVKFGGADVPAGTYALYTVPGPDEWTVILYTNTALWGSFKYDAKDDFVRVKAKPVKLAEPVETFTIDINDIRDESATLNLIWEKTRVPVKLEMDLTARLVPQIEALMAESGGQKPYFQAAQFYFDHGQDLQKALKWVDAAITQREAHYIVYLKAKILAKLGDKPGAIAAAKRSMELAKEAKDSGYVKLNEELIASLK